VKRILIADQRPKIRYGLQVLLQGQLGYHIIGFAVDSQSLLGNLDGLTPDILLLDWNLPGMTSAELINYIHNRYPQIRIMVMSANPDARTNALSMGADFYINKAEAPTVFLETLQNCAESLPI
jgi:DNA-binding NarL/FixJ family response regulator